MDKKFYLAIDIGASSGRHIVGWRDDDEEEIKTKEVYRFPNAAKRKDGHLVWDMEEIFGHVQTGIDAALQEFPRIESLSVDTWGVDYVLMRGDEPVTPVYAYRDSRTQDVIPKVHGIISHEEMYRRTGIQFNAFNTVYQLFADKEAGRLCGVTDFLMLPCYLMQRLCGVKAHEYTNATTTGLVNAKTRNWDDYIIGALELDCCEGRMFGEISQPGKFIGDYKGIKVVLCATHDTGSAVEGIPMTQNAPYISSGTWSLLGVKTANALTDEGSDRAMYSNEGGIGYNRYQKNIMGMWLVQELRKELCPETDFGTIAREASSSAFDETVDADAEIFLSPVSMKGAFDEVLHTKPDNAFGYFRCAYRSLALSYKKAIDDLERNTGERYDDLYIVGGGAKNDFLNKLTEAATGKHVIALPIEASAIGNLKVQMESGK